MSMSMIPLLARKHLNEKTIEIMEQMEEEMNIKCLESGIYSFTYKDVTLKTVNFSDPDIYGKIGLTFLLKDKELNAILKQVSEDEENMDDNLVKRAAILMSQIICNCYVDVDINKAFDLIQDVFDEITFHIVEIIYLAMFSAAEYNLAKMEREQNNVRIH